jgi:NADPH2:quinone reductase
VKALVAQELTGPSGLVYTDVVDPAELDDAQAVSLLVYGKVVLVP